MFEKVISDLLKHKAVKVVFFISPKEIVRVVRTRYGNKFNTGNIELTLTKGKPNFAERIIVKKFGKKVSGMTFFKYLPIKKK